MCKRGDIYYVNFSDEVGGHYQRGRRPALIVSNNSANHHSHMVTVVPLTSQVRKKPLPTHVFLPKGVIKGLRHSSLVLAEQVSTIDKELLSEKMASVWGKEWLKKVDRALKVQLDL